MGTGTKLSRQRLSPFEPVGALGRILIPRLLGRTSLPLLVAVIAFAFGCGPESEPAERPAVRDLPIYDLENRDTVPIPEPPSAFCA